MNGKKEPKPGKKTIAEFMENGPDAELGEELGYSKYDYRNKETDNSRNGHSSKTLKTSFGEVEASVPRDRKGEFEPQLLKKHQTSISQDIEEKILSMCAKGMTTSDIAWTPSTTMCAVKLSHGVFRIRLKMKWGRGIMISVQCMHSNLSICSLKSRSVKEVRVNDLRNHPSL